MNPVWTAEARAARVDELLGAAPILPVLAINDIDDAVPLARTLMDAGLPVLEVTLRSDVALEAIARIAREVPQAIVGAGTVLDAAALEAVTRAGAQFAISPGATDALYDAADRTALPWIPAIATASEAMRGLDRGHRRFKFFPAVPAGGIGALKAFAGPLPQAKFCPTGGIDANSAAAFLAQPNVITVGGSWMVPSAALKSRDWQHIAELAQGCVAIRANARA